ncbi:branched-chain amino acid permease [Neisseria meningitidis]|nr:branched-chain amino acid permease [Neisseria meningitidis]
MSERFSCYARKLCQIGRLIFVGYYRESVFLSIRQEAGNHFGQYSGLTKPSTALPRLSSKRTIL